MMDIRIIRMFNEAKLECELNILDKQMEETLFMNDIYMFHIDEEYKDKLRDMKLIEEVRHRMTNLLVIIDKINDIEEHAIANNNHDLMWKCENRKAKLRNQMELLRSKYDL